MNSRWFGGVLGLLLSLGIMFAAQAVPKMDEQAIFVSGEEGYHTYRIPAILRAASGTLLAFCEGRKHAASDTGEIHLLLRRSADNGDTWGPVQIVWRDASNTCGNPAPVLDPATGTVHLLTTWNLGTDSEKRIIAGTSEDTRRVFHLFSTDEGVSWSDPREITQTTKRPEWAWYATGPGAGIALRRGSQAGRLLVACDHIGREGKEVGSHVIYSDDGGRNWQLGAVAVASDTVRSNENLAVELMQPARYTGGSRVFFLARDLQGPHNRAVAFSMDGGSNYLTPFFTDAPSFVTPVVQGGLARFQASDQGDPINCILFSCPQGDSRSRLSIWSSADEGLSWSEPKLLYEGPAAYSDMTRLADERMAILYERGIRAPYETIHFSRFNREWLDTPDSPREQPGAALWEFGEREERQTIATVPGAIHDTHPDGHDLHLTANEALKVVAGAPGRGDGKALSFTGQGGLFLSDKDSENRVDFGPDDSFTIEVMCRIPSLPAQVGALVAKDLAPHSPSWWLRVQDGIVRFLVSDHQKEAVLSSTARVSDGKWHHLAAVRDASQPGHKQLLLYVDGNLSGSVADKTTGTLANGRALWIGSFNEGRHPLIGEIDWVRLTPAALTPEEFQKGIRKENLDDQRR